MLVALSAGLAIGMAAVITARMTAQYAASITLIVSAPGDGTSTSSDYMAVLLSQQRVKSYANLMRSRRVATGVARTLNNGLTADDLRGRISAEAVPDTVLIKATVTDTSPSRAQQVANALGTEFSRFVAEIERPPAGKRTDVQITVADDADLPTAPTSPRPFFNLVLGALIGLVAGAAAAILREMSDTSVRSRNALSEATGRATLGAIAFERSASGSPLIVRSGFDSPAAEAFRELRTVLQFADAGRPPRSVAVTSAETGEGKSTIACNLAVTLADVGLSVVLVDADLRDPRVAGHLGIDASTGLSDVLQERAGFEESLQRFGPGTLSVLPGGPVPPNPSELLASARMRELLAELQDRADVVLVDTPALRPATDAAILAKSCAGVLLVARYGGTRRERVAGAVEQLEAVGATLLGGVLNVVPADLDHGFLRDHLVWRPALAGRPAADPDAG